MNEQQVHALAGLTLVSRFFYQALHQAPNAEFIQAMYAENVITQWPVETNNTLLIEGLAKLAAQPELKLIAEDYARLFIGPNSLAAPPWGSVYLTEEQIVFGASTVAINAFYHQFGIEIDTGMHEPADHIGLVFSFLAHLGERLLQQPDANVLSLAPLNEFLTLHVLPWAPRMLHLMREQASTAFYQGVSLAAEASLAQFAALTGAEYLPLKLYR